MARSDSLQITPALPGWASCRRQMITGAIRRRCGARASCVGLWETERARTPFRGLRRPFGVPCCASLRPPQCGTPSSHVFAQWGWCKGRMKQVVVPVFKPRNLNVIFHYFMCTAKTRHAGLTVRVGRSRVEGMEQEVSYEVRVVSRAGPGWLSWA